MEKHYQNIRNFLKDTENFAELIESDSLIWVNWGEYDEDIISYVNEKIEDKIQVRFISNHKPYGDDICLKYEEKSLVIPYKEKMDGDTTIKYINEIMKPMYEIRFCIDSIGSDTLAFVVLHQNLWEELENEFGKEKVGYYFDKITLQSRMFDMDFETVFKIRGERPGIK